MSCFLLDMDILGDGGLVGLMREDPAHSSGALFHYVPVEKRLRSRGLCSNHRARGCG
jgi:hypothetical protein